jgi:DNA-binding transcriptional ArsR family regulator
MNHELPETHVVRSPEQAAALLNPLRAEILAIVREPASAAEVARKIGDTPQRINYHLKSLEKVGLVRRVGTRQVRNLVEVLYQAIAKSFLLSEAVGLNPETSERIKEQGALAHLITLSDRIRRDALLLMERSEENKGQIPSASLQMKVHLDSEERRRAFLRDYAAMLEELVNRYGAAGEGDENAFRVTAVIYPETPKGGTPE